MSTGVSSSRSLWIFWGDSLWDLSSGSLDGWCIGPSCSRPSLVACEFLLGNNPSSSSLVWRVCDQPSCEQLVSAPRFLQLSLNMFTHWWRFAMDVCVSIQPSSALLITSAIISSKRFATSFISDIILSKIFSSSDLVVGQWHTECDHEQSSLSFHFERQDVLSHSQEGHALMFLGQCCHALLCLYLYQAVQHHTLVRHHSYWGTLVPHLLIHLL